MFPSLAEMPVAARENAKWQLEQQKDKWRYVMYDMELTVDERQCLRMWFRQAIAHVEKEEVKKIIREEHSTVNHHARFFSARRIRRTRINPLIKELV